LPTTSVKGAADIHADAISLQTPRDSPSCPASDRRHDALILKVAKPRVRAGARRPRPRRHQPTRFDHPDDRRDGWRCRLLVFRMRSAPSRATGDRRRWRLRRRASPRRGRTPSPAGCRMVGARQFHRQSDDAGAARYCPSRPNRDETHAREMHGSEPRRPRSAELDAADRVPLAAETIRRLPRRRRRGLAWNRCQMNLRPLRGSRALEAMRKRRPQRRRSAPAGRLSA